MLKSFLAICLFLALCTPLAAQSPAFQQEGIATDYQFTVDGEPMDVSWQMILKRGRADGTQGIAGASDVQIYYLEIATTDTGLVSTNTFLRYKLSFYDENDELILSRFLSVERFDASTRHITLGDTNFYRVKLLSLPFAIFDLARRIDIVVH